MALLWSTKRRFIYGGGFVTVIALLAGLLFWNVFYKAPTCSDGKKNGDEKAIDCGGSCKNLCTSDALTPIVLWTKVFNVSGDVYNIVAYVENPNINSKNSKVTYQFRIFDTNNKVVTVKDGSTSIPKGKKFAIFETGLVLKNVTPKSADIRLTSFAKWEKDTNKEPEIDLSYGTFLGTTTAPYLEGVVKNKSIDTIQRVELVVFALDGNENVIGASRTFVDNLYKNTSQDFVFTWPKPFDREATLVNVIYRVY